VALFLCPLVALFLDSIFGPLLGSTYGVFLSFGGVDQVHLWLRSTAQGHSGMGNRKSRIRPPQTNEVFHGPDSPMTASNRGMKGLDRGNARKQRLQ